MKKRFLTFNQWQTVFRRADDDAGTGAGADDAAEIAKMESEAKLNKGADLASAAEAAKSDKDFLSDDNTFKKEDFDKADEEEKPAEKIAADKKIASDKADAEEKELAEKKKSEAKVGAKAEEEKPAEVAAKKKEDEGAAEEDEDFKVTEIPSDNVDDEESDWKTVGKELGFEVSENTFEAFKKANDENIATQVATVKSGMLDQELAELKDTEAKQLFEFVKNGGTVSDYVNPMKEYDEFLSLGDEALVRKTLELRKWDADKIDSHIVALKEDGKLENEAYPLRKVLENGKETTRNNILTTQKELAESQRKTRLDESIKENASIKAAIDKTDMYLGKKVSPEAKAAVNKKWASGFYQKQFATNPEFVKEAIFSWELAEQRTAAAKKEGYDKGLHKNQEKLHNLPKNTQEKGSKNLSEVKPVGGEGDFSSWKTAVEEA